MVTYLYMKIFSLPTFWIIHGYYREKLKINHFWELRVLTEVCINIGD